MKDNFTVTYSRRVNGQNYTVIILGATSIVPNMNGISIQCVNRQYGLQIENYEMDKAGAKLHIEYSTDKDIQDYFQCAKDDPIHYTVRDGREN